MLCFACGEWPHRACRRNSGEVAQALEVPIYQLIYDGDHGAKALPTEDRESRLWGSFGKKRALLPSAQAVFSPHESRGTGPGDVYPKRDGAQEKVTALATKVQCRTRVSAFAGVAFSVSDF
jgi:hypothetical protein